MTERLQIDLELEFRNLRQEFDQFRDRATDAAESVGESLEDSVSGSTRRGTQQASTLFTRFTGGITSQIGRIGLAFAGAFSAVALVRGVGNATRAFNEFESELNGVRTLLSDNSFASTGQNLQEGFDGLRDGVREVFTDLPVAISSVNTALFDTVSAGIDASRAIDTVRIAGELAVAGQTDISTATRGLTTALNAFGLEAEQAENAAASFFRAQQAGRTTIAELSGSLGTVAADANLVGISLEDTLSALSALTLSGRSTSESATGLRAAIAAIINPTEDARREAERLGIAFDAQIFRREGGFVRFINELREAGGNTAESLSQLFGSVRASGSIAALSNAQFESLVETTENLGDNAASVQTFSGALNQQLMGSAEQAQIFRNNLRDLGIEIGEVLQPIIASLVSGLSSLVGFLRDLPSILSSVARFAAITAGSFVLLNIQLIATGVATGLTTAFATLGTVLSGLPIIIGLVTTRLATLRVGIALTQTALTLGLSVAILGAVELFDMLLTSFGSLRRIGDSLFNGFILGVNTALLRVAEFSNFITGSSIARFFNGGVAIQIDTTLFEENVQIATQNIIDLRRETQREIRLRLRPEIVRGGGGGGGDTENPPAMDDDDGGGGGTTDLTEQQEALRSFVIQNQEFVRSNQAVVESAAASVTNSGLIISQALVSTQAQTQTLTENLQSLVEPTQLMGSQLAFQQFILSNLEFAEANRDLILQASTEIQNAASIFDEAVVSMEAGAARVSNSLTSLRDRVRSTGRQLRVDFNQLITNTVQNGINAMVQALEAGQNPLRAFLGSVLTSFGDFSIELGTQAILIGILADRVREAVLMLDGTRAIVAGAALVAAGIAFRALGNRAGGSSSGSTSAPIPTAATTAAAPAPASAVSTTSSDIGVTDDEEEFERTRSSNVQVTIQGDVLDSDQTSLRIVELIENAGFLGAEAV